MMPLFWIVLVGLIVWAVVSLAQPGRRASGSADYGQARRETPQEILDRRFASGEIDAQEHLAARQHLKAAAEADPAARR